MCIWYEGNIDGVNTKEMYDREERQFVLKIFYKWDHCLTGVIRIIFCAALRENKCVVAMREQIVSFSKIFGQGTFQGIRLAI